MPIIKTAKVRAKAANDFDSPWKLALDLYLCQFLEYCFPDIAQEIDWERGYDALDKELQKIEYHATGGKRFADKLFKLWKMGGQATLLLFHVEIQNSAINIFPTRMLDYRCYIRNYYRLPIVSIAILADGNPRWRPNHYSETCFGSSLEIHYRIVKLLDYQEKREELLRSNDRFALIILAQLAVLETHRQPQTRLTVKIALIRELYKKGFSKEDIFNLYKLIDWLMTLPEQLQVEYNEAVKQIEEEKEMTYITTAERLGIEQGLRLGVQQGVQQGIQQGVQQGIQQGIQQGEATLLIRLLQRRFGNIPAHYLELIQQASSDLLLLWGERVLKAVTVEEIFQEN
jgi:hypothetical protein